MTRSNWVAAAAAFVGLALSAPQAWGHAELVSPRPRSPGAKKEPGPCGGVLATGNPTPLIAGSTLKVDFKETVDHPGRYRIAFSPNATDTVAIYDANILLNNIPDLQGAVSDLNPRNYSANITVPTTLCNPCSLQLIQYMTENTPPTLYYSCADIRIVAPGTQLDGGVATPDAGTAGSDAGTVVIPEDDAGTPVTPRPDGGGGIGPMAETDGDAPSFCVLSVTGNTRSGAAVLVIGLAFAVILARRRRRR